MRRFVTTSIVTTGLLLTSLTPAFAMTDATTSAHNNLGQSLKPIRKELKGTITQDKNDFKEKLTQIRDERKRTIVDKLNTKVPTLNQNLTSRMQNALTRMTERLNLIKLKVATLKESGKNTTTLENAITSAEEAISTATKAIEVQQGKQYTITITTETNLRQTIGPVIKQMETDLRATYQTIVAAHKAMLNVESALRALSPEAEGKNPTASEAAQ